MSRIMKFAQFINEAEEQIKVIPMYGKGGDSLEKVKVEFSGNQSAQVTKMVNKFAETYELLKQAEASHEEIKQILKDKINTSLPQEYIFITKIIETAKYCLTFSKYTKAREEEVETVDYKAAMDEIMDIFPDIKEGLTEIIKKHTEVKKIVKKETAGAIKYAHINLNEGISDIFTGLIDKLKGIFSSLTKSLKGVNRRIDSKLKKIDQIMKG